MKMKRYKKYIIPALLICAGAYFGGHVIWSILNF